MEINETGAEHPQQVSTGAEWDFFTCEFSSMPSLGERGRTGLQRVAAPKMGSGIGQYKRA
jgi:hypothetical protein